MVQLFVFIFALLAVSLASKINLYFVSLNKSFVIDDEGQWSIHTIVNDFYFFLSWQTCGWSTKWKRSGQCLCVLFVLLECHIELVCSLDYKNSDCTLTGLRRISGYASFIAQMILLQHLEHHPKLCSDFKTLDSSRVLSKEIQIKATKAKSIKCSLLIRLLVFQQYVPQQAFLFVFLLFVAFTVRWWSIKKRLFWMCKL